MILFILPLRPGSVRGQREIYLLGKQLGGRRKRQGNSRSDSSAVSPRPTSRPSGRRWKTSRVSMHHRGTSRQQSALAAQWETDRERRKSGLEHRTRAQTPSKCYGFCFIIMYSL